MKNILLLLLLFTGIVNGQIVNIPDANFKAKLLASTTTNGIASDANGYMRIDANNNGEIEVTEALPVVMLKVNLSQISSMTGIEYFINLKDLDCTLNQITTLDLSAMNMIEVDCRYNQLTSLNVSTSSSLRYLRCSYNQLVILSLPSSNNLISLECNDNQLANLNIAGSSTLAGLDCSNNQLTNLNLSGLSNMAVLNCVNNEIASLNFIDLNNIWRVQCASNQLTQLDLPESVKYLDCSNNLISSLDLSHLVLEDYNSFICSNNPLTNIELPQLSQSAIFGLEFICSNTLLTDLDLTNIELAYLECNNNPNLRTLMIKGAIGDYGEFNELTFMEVNNNPNLYYVCADEAYFDYITLQLYLDSPQQDYVINSYCSFTPGGDYNTITGTTLYDLLGDGCDPNDLANPYLKVNINDGTNSGSTFSNTTGNYSFYTQAGNFTVTPELENPSYFNFSPPNAVINFPVVDNSTQTQNFCITANGVHPDLEVTFVPLNNARPGFDANYKIIYKNKGNQTLSGDIKLSYDSTKLDFIATFPDVNFEINPDEILWNYSSLLPLETRSINLTLHVIAPPIVNNGDVLNFTTTINPILADETPLDNVFVLNQTVVNSYDPNQIACLEGNTITPEEVGNYLHYNINFENIGTADAINIVVKDSINTAKFNINSLQLQYASHDVETKVSGNIVEFIFKNIHLQPSNGGPIGGHGNVLFKIKTLPNLIIGDEVMGSASIFFDYNAPIATNEERTLIASLSKDDFIKDETVTVAPNPTRNTITVASKNKLKSVMLFDVQGRLLQTILEYNKTTTLDISNQANGVYFLKVITEVGSSVEKIVKEN